MSEQQSTLAVVAEPAPVADAPGTHANKHKNAADRVKELLRHAKIAKQKHAAELAALRKDLEQVRLEMMDVLAENGELKSREEQRLQAVEEDRKAAQKAAEDRRLLCFRALVDAAHQTGAYQKHPDFDTRLKRTQQDFSTPLLESILCFPKEMAPELAYVVASEPAAVAKLSALSPSAQLFWLIKMNREFEEKLKWARLSDAR